LIWQAEVLAKFKPWINTTLLMVDLKQTEETATKAIEYFSNTHHIVLYYEDLLKNRTVITTRYLIYYFIHQDIFSDDLHVYNIEFSFSETQGCSRISEIAI